MMLFTLKDSLAVLIPVSVCAALSSVLLQVIKCIVEVLADTLSKPYSLPVSQQCLETLRTGEMPFCITLILILKKVL